MKYCSKCANYQFVVLLSCGCDVTCLDCTLSSFSAQISSHRFVPCLSLKCTGYSPHSIPVEEALEVAAGSPEEATVLEELCRRALGQLEGAVVCAGCGCVGWVDTSKSCSDSVECGLCGHLWDLQLAATCFRVVPKLLLTRVDDKGASSASAPLLAAEKYEYVPDNISLECSGSFVRWLQYYWDQQCPSCGSFNGKDGTCVISAYCPECNCYYCWVCQMPHAIHKWSCANSSGVWLSLHAILKVALLIKASYSFLSPSATSAAVITILWLLWQAICGLLTIVLPGFCLLLMGLVVHNGSPEAPAALVLGVADIAFVAVALGTGWWSEWFGILAALAFAAGHYLLVARNMLTFRM